MGCARLRRGRVSVASDGPGKGAVFRVELPRGPVRSEGSAPPTATALPRVDGVRVLLVVDDPDSRLIVERAIRDAGGHVRVAVSVEEARARIDEELPDVLLSDIGMPGEDGYELVAWLRAHRDARVRAAAVCVCFQWHV